jgi:hypothetical protein
VTVFAAGRFQRLRIARAGLRAGVRGERGLMPPVA